MTRPVTVYVRGWVSLKDADERIAVTDHVDRLNRGRQITFKIPFSQSLQYPLCLFGTELIRATAIEVYLNSVDFIDDELRMILEHYRDHFTVTLHSLRYLQGFEDDSEILDEYKITRY